ncbi:MAG: nucleotidyltransferase family protein, partial [Faecalibacillus sp.]
MNHIFLSLLKDARRHIKSDPVELDFIKLYRLAREHQVSPLIYNQIYSFPGFPEDLKIHWKKEAIQENVFQTIKTERFLKLYQQFLDHDLKIIVVKGVILRSLYPQPENRPSNDEDLYIEKKDFEKAKDLFLKEKFVITGESDDVTTFVDYQCGLSIELHTSLFSKDS